MTMTVTWYQGLVVQAFAKSFRSLMGTAGLSVVRAGTVIILILVLCWQAFVATIHYVDRDGGRLQGPYFVLS